MKKHLLFKSLIVAVSAAATLGTALAVDTQERIREEQIGGVWSNDTPSDSPSERAPATDNNISPGARGPMRSDMMNTRPEDRLGRTIWDYNKEYIDLKTEKEKESRYFVLPGP